MLWYVYMIRCTDNTLYTGITTDVERRFRDHASGRGAKYFRSHRPERIVYVESGHSRSSASKRETEIKALTRAAKAALTDREPFLHEQGFTQDDTTVANR